MKRILLLLILMLSISAEAQIQRSFFGFTLGVSNRQIISSHFKRQNKTIKNEDDVLVVKNLKFGGQMWDEVRFVFYKNKFYQIFLVTSTERNSKEYLDERWDYLLNKFLKKYRNYYQPMSSDTKYFCDNKTTLRFHYEFSGGLWYQDLVYYDNKLFDSSMRDDDDDL